MADEQLKAYSLALAVVAKTAIERGYDKRLFLTMAAEVWDSTLAIKTADPEVYATIGD
ncbi:MAG: hypothetical protein GWP08_20335 [Nitrospiraceae bacterium]|nr:hypothetical protein [Nitrospiraceae bacterium]